MSRINTFTIFTRIGSSLIIPAIPIGGWYYTANQDRHSKSEEIRTKVRVPNVQTIDDLMIEKCQPGDIILFDRRCYKCAAGPGAAFSCILGKQLLCDSDDNKKKSSGKNRKIADIGKVEHVGIVVPGYSRNKAEATDPSNLLLLEATAGEGVVARPLLQRLEMSQSRSVVLLPLASPGEQRNDNDDSYEPSRKTIKMQDHLNKKLAKFRDEWVHQSKQQNYAMAHSFMGIIGSIGYATGLYKASSSPVSPSTYLAVTALMEAGAGLNLSKRTAFEAKAEDFLRDYRFCNDDVIRLRPGWRFLAPVVMRETSKS